MLIEATKNLTDYLKSQNKGYSTTDLRTLYGGMNLEGRLGSYSGTGSQHRGMLNLLQVEQTIADVKTKTSAIGSMIRQGVQLGAAGVQITPQTEFAPTEEYAKAYPEFGELKEGALRITPDGKIEQALPTGEFAEVVGQDQFTKTPYEYGYAIPKDIKGNIQTPLGTNDLAGIIGKISSGEIEVPEVAIAKEASGLAKGDEKMRAAQALESTQQMLAKKGMAFSGIRTETEANLAAEHLSRMSGISLRLASTIISAARQEQTRVKPTYRSVGGALYEMIPGEEPRKVIEAEQNIESMTYQGQRWEKDPATGEWKLAFELPEQTPSLQTVKSNIVSDINRAVDQYKLNPEGFRERYIEALVATHGEEHRKYITNQTYALMPSIIEGEKELTKWQLEATVNQWLGTPSSLDGGSDLSNEEKAIQIRLFGLNPEDFGIYD